MNINTTIIAALLALGTATAGTAEETEGVCGKKENGMENPEMTNEWDKVFPRSDNVIHRKVTFKNRYGITLAADMYAPKNAGGKLPAIAVSGPFGAVKEQSSGLYAQTMAERGFPQSAERCKFLLCTVKPNRIMDVSAAHSARRTVSCPSACKAPQPHKKKEIRRCLRSIFW